MKQSEEVTWNIFACEDISIARLDWYFTLVSDCVGSVMTALTFRPIGRGGLELTTNEQRSAVEKPENNKQSG